MDSGEKIKCQIKIFLKNVLIGQIHKKYYHI